MSPKRPFQYPTQTNTQHHNRCPRLATVKRTCSRGKLRHSPPTIFRTAPMQCIPRHRNRLRFHDVVRSTIQHEGAKRTEQQTQPENLSEHPSTQFDSHSRFLSRTRCTTQGNNGRTHHALARCAVRRRSFSQYVGTRNSSPSMEVRNTEVLQRRGAGI
jgi:hypothetical protein